MDRVVFHHAMVPLCHHAIMPSWCHHGAIVVPSWCHHGAIMPWCHGSWTGVVGHPEKTEGESVAHVRSKAARALQKIKIILLCILFNL